MLWARETCTNVMKCFASQRFWLAEDCDQTHLRWAFFNPAVQHSKDLTRVHCTLVLGADSWLQLIFLRLFSSVSCHFRLKNFSSSDLAFSSGKDFGEDSGLAVYVAEAIDASINWEDIKWLRGLTSLPIVAKGILRGV